MITDIFWGEKKGHILFFSTSVIVVFFVLINLLNVLLFPLSTSKMFIFTCVDNYSNV